MATPKPPTIDDVARLAGTSKATVSNVMHDHVNVRPETRARVLAAIDALGYHVNIAARSLVQQRTRAIGVLLGDLENPWYAKLAAHMEREARAHGYSVLIASTGDEPLRDAGTQVEASRIRDLVEHRVAAIVFLAFSGNPGVVRAVPRDTPTVFVGLYGPGGPCVTVDDHLGAHLAVSHLVELGHRRIGYVSTNSDADPITDDDRFAGYRQTLEAIGAFETGEHVIARLEGSLRDEAPASLARRRIDELLTAEDRPTAIFAASDFTAIEVLSRADALGISVPDELSLVGFDDISMAGMDRIALTTIAQPARELAARGIETAIALATDEAEVVRSRTLLEPKLVVRGTTAPPRTA